MFVVSDVALRQFARHEVEIGLADHFLGCVAKGLGQRFIDDDEVALFVFDPGYVGNVVEERALLLAQRFIYLLPLSDVADGAHHQYAFLGFQKDEADFDEELRAVFPQSAAVVTRCAKCLTTFPKLQT